MSDLLPPLPAFASWPTFPFEGELRIKQLDEPVAEEPPRHGEDPSECSACRAPDDAYIWVSERWRVRALDRPTGLPMVLILESRSHLDLGDLPNLLAAELGVLTVRLERAIRSLDGVARVHVNRWGDGSAHLHVWFLARPYGRLQLRGTFLSLWDDILPRIPEAQWRENLAMVAAWLADFGGRSIAEPPHIDWQAPARFSIPAGVETTTAGSGEADDEDETGAAGIRADGTTMIETGERHGPIAAEAPAGTVPAGTVPAATAVLAGDGQEATGSAATAGDSGRDGAGAGARAGAGAGASESTGDRSRALGARTGGAVANQTATTDQTAPQDPGTATETVAGGVRR